MLPEKNLKQARDSKYLDVKTPDKYFQSLGYKKLISLTLDEAIHPCDELKNLLTPDQLIHLMEDAKQVASMRVSKGTEYLNEEREIQILI